MDVCELDRECTTLADIRDAIREAAKDAVKITPVKECQNAYVTYRDGDFVVTPQEPGTTEDEPFPLEHATAKDWGVPKKQKPCLDRTLKDIYGSVSGLGDRAGDLFGNGRNYLKCVMAAPPEGCEGECDNKFLVVFPEVEQFDAGMNRMDDSPEGAGEILAAAHECPCASRMGDQQTEALKRALKCKEKLETLAGKLEKMTDGLGWRCTLDQYIDDKYSREIVNAAMQHGIDVSRDSQFVKSLVRRLAEIAARGKPTKSDLATYAKSDKVDFKSDACRQFLADVEQNAEQTNEEVLGPVREFSKCLAQTAAALAAAAAAFDASGDAKELEKLQVLSEDDVVPGRKALEGVVKYCGRGPKTRIVGCNGRLYVMTSDFAGINAIANLFGV